MAFDPMTAAISGGADVISTAMQNMQAQTLANQAQSFDVSQSQWQTMANQQQALETQAYNAQEAQKQRDFAAQQVQQQQAYETQMSNTAYQRSRQDMIAAGLNPMMMAGMGGASTPTVSAASGSAASAPSTAPAVGARGVVAPVHGLFQNAARDAIAGGLAEGQGDLLTAQAGAADASASQSRSVGAKADQDTIIGKIQASLQSTALAVARALAGPQIERANIEEQYIKNNPDVVRAGLRGSDQKKSAPDSAIQVPYMAGQNLGQAARDNAAVPVGIMQRIRAKVGGSPTPVGPNNAYTSATSPFESANMYGQSAGGGF